jgi:hypothetical protein
MGREAVNVVVLKEFLKEHCHVQEQDAIIARQQSKLTHLMRATEGQHPTRTTSTRAEDAFEQSLDIADVSLRPSKIEAEPFPNFLTNLRQNSWKDVRDRLEINANGPGCETRVSLGQQQTSHRPVLFTSSLEGGSQRVEALFRARSEGLIRHIYGESRAVACDPLCRARVRLNSARNNSALIVSRSRNRRASATTAAQCQSSFECSND